MVLGREGLMVDADVEAMSTNALLAEALNRGAHEAELVRLLGNYERERSAPPMVRPTRFTLGVDTRLTLSPDFATWLHVRKIADNVSTYRARVSDEFAALPDDVQAPFSAADNSSPINGYFVMRPIYYRAGYTDPAKTVFSKIGAATFLGHRVAGGLHEKFRERLPGVEKTLNEWSPDLVTQTAKGIRAIGGFVPRFIAAKQGHPKRTTTLSNHAFGMAIDIDSSFNPHLKDKDAIEVVREVTGFDFGKQIVADDKSISKMDQAAQTHLKMMEASRRLQAWFQRYLPIYESFETTGNAPRHKSSASIPGIKLDDQPELKSCEPPDTETANQMYLIGVLRRFHSRAELEHWAKYGIQSIPLCLVVAMAKHGFTWGAMYKTSKDFMHFELEAHNVLPPDRAPCTLEELFRAPRVVAMRLKSEGQSSHRARSKGHPATAHRQ